MKAGGILIITLSVVVGIVCKPHENDGSRCNGVSCSPPLPGAQCSAQYNEACCPVWTCTMNGATSTIYGRSQSGSSSNGNSFSSSWSSNSGSGGGGQQQGVLPQIRLPNIFGSLFG